MRSGANKASGFACLPALAAAGRAKGMPRPECEPGAPAMLGLRSHVFGLGTDGAQWADEGRQSGFARARCYTEHVDRGVDGGARLVEQCQGRTGS